MPKGIEPSSIAHETTVLPLNYSIFLLIERKETSLNFFCWNGRQAGLKILCLWRAGSTPVRKIEN